MMDTKVDVGYYGCLSRLVALLTTMQVAVSMLCCIKFTNSKLERMQACQLLSYLTHYGMTYHIGNMLVNCKA